jgi:methyl-accepting chemotaxis protein
MKSIKSKILLSFCLIATLIIGLIGVVVSWKLDQSIAQQSEHLVAEMTAQTQQLLANHYHLLASEFHRTMQHSLENVSKHPNLITNLELKRPAALTAVLDMTMKTDKMDFALVLNLKGQLQASFPGDLSDLDVEAYLAAWPFGAHLLKVLRGEIKGDPLPVWDAFSTFDAKALNVLGLKRQDMPEQGTIGLVAAGMIQNDFGDPLGLCLVGKLLKDYTTPLRQVYEVTGAASVLYFDTTPIVQAGFDPSDGGGVDLSTLQINADIQAKIYQAQNNINLMLTLGKNSYLTTCAAVKSFDHENIGSLCVGVPEAEILKTQQTILSYGVKTKESVQRWILGIGIFSLGVFVVLSLGLAGRIVRPLKQLSFLAKNIAIGNAQQGLLITSQDEIGDLSRSLSKVIQSFHEITEVSEAIAVGDLRHDFTPRSSQDVLGQALQGMSAYLKKMASLVTVVAGGDLTETIQRRSDNDVFGQAIQRMTEGLQSLIIQIRNSAEQMAAIETKLLGLSNEDLRIVANVNVSVRTMIETIREITTSVQEVADNMDILSSSVETTSSSVAQMTPSIEQIVSNTDTLTQQIHGTREFLTEAVNALEKVVADTDVSKELSQQTIQDALKGEEAITQVTTSMSLLHETMNTAVKAITSFSQRSADIGTILNVIREITDQTSLLALNASIIAAQAGVHGRGFAVVAEEIKSLANGVANSTKDIAKIVKSLQQETDKVVETVHESERNVEQGMARTQQAQIALLEIITSAERSSVVVTDISEALHHLMTNTYNVADAMERVNDLTGEIHTATNEQEISTVQINQAISEINQLALQIRESTTYQSTGLQQVLTATGDITTLIDQNFESSQDMTQVTKELASQAERLLQVIHRFKLDRNA